MYYLSFDCANKSLGVSLFKFQDNYKFLIIKLLKNYNPYITLYENIVNMRDKLSFCDYYKLLENINDIVDKIFVIDLFDVINILNDKKTKNINIIERSLGLKQALNKIDKLLVNINEDINICIEYQLNYNDKSRTVYNQLIYHYSDIDNYHLHIIAPTYKNKLYFNDELKYSSFIQKYNSNYTANKSHTKNNFIYFIDVFGLKEQTKHIKSKNMDDIADSFMQAIHLIKNHR